MTVGTIWIRPPRATAMKVRMLNGSQFSSRRSYQRDQVAPLAASLRAAMKPKAREASRATMSAPRGRKIQPRKRKKPKASETTGSARKALRMPMVSALPRAMTATSRVSLTGRPLRAVRQRFQSIRPMPTRYMPPPMMRKPIIGRMAVRVSMKFG